MKSILEHSRNTWDITVEVLTCEFYVIRDFFDRYTVELKGGCVMRN
jgi:hypothetical protein